jgi:hypothetical protein
MLQLLINLLHLLLFERFTELIDEIPSEMPLHTAEHEVCKGISSYEDEKLSNH